jgi:hypothetical protein
MQVGRFAGGRPPAAHQVFAIEARQLVPLGGNGG